MIVVRMQGGLGNQLFQYAAGFRLAQVRADELRLDVSLFGEAREGLTPRRFELGDIVADAREASPQDISRLTTQRRIVRESGFAFEPRALDAPRDTYLDGYWQSERYFQDVSSSLREALDFRSPLEGTSRDVADRLAACASVAIHVRRGDYVTDPKIAARHGVLPVAYYQRAALEIAREVERPEFFVFSDDPRWVRESLHLDYPIHVVDHNDAERGHADLRLMSLCRHHVIANSSFSWWGAWLSTSPQKIVIAPRHWFADPAANTETTSLFPPGWKTL